MVSPGKYYVAYNLQKDPERFSRYIVKKNYSKIAKNRVEGPKTHPWGTVLLIIMADVIAESILTVCGLSLRNLCIQWMIGGGILEL